MPNKKNKVKFNICNVHYALITVDEDGEVTFGTPVAMPGAVSLSLEPNGEPSNFYADGYAYLVRVSITDLNIRKGPGTNYAKTGKFTGKGVFTIVEMQTGKGSDTGWGRLKSGAGWISLDYTEKIS